MRLFQHIHLLDFMRAAIAAGRYITFNSSITVLIIVITVCSFKFSIHGMLAV